MDNSKKIRIINKIISLCENDVSLEFEIFNNNHRYVRSRGLCFTVKNFKENYNKIVGNIFRDLRLGNAFSINYVEKFIDILISEALKKGIENVKINPLIIDCFEDEFQDVIVYIPLDGIDLDVREMQIGKITLKMFTENEIDEIYNEIENLWLNNHYNKYLSTDMDLKIIKNVIFNFKGKVMAEFSMFADEDTAIEEAKKECEVAIDFMRFANHFFHSRESSSIGLESEIKRGNYQIIVHKANFYGYRIANEYKGPIFEFEINDSTLEHMEKIDIFKLLNTLNKSNIDRTNFEKLILSGIHWFSDSMIQKQIENQFLSLMISLEIFLTPRGELISNYISDATARILTSGLKNRMELKDDIKEFYEKRSAIVHGRRNKMPSIGDVSSLQNIVALLILWMIKKSDYFTEKKDLMNHIETRKLA